MLHKKENNFSNDSYNDQLIYMYFCLAMYRLQILHSWVFCWFFFVLLFFFLVLSPSRLEKEGRKGGFLI